MSKKIARGRDMTLAPIAQPSDGITRSPADYQTATRSGNQANQNQRHRQGTAKFFDNSSDRPTVAGNGVQMTPGLRED